MSRYQPTTDEQAAIDLLRLAGYAVVRQRAYDGLQERVRIAEAERDWAGRDAQSAERWAIRESDEHRRLADRLNRVCAAAAAQGVTIHAINAALEAAAAAIAPCPDCDSGEHPTCSACGTARNDLTVGGGS